MTMASAAPVQIEGGELGASASADRATHEQSPQAVSAVPVGIPSADAFKPSSYDGKPRWMPREHSEALSGFLQIVWARLDEQGEDDLRLILDACLSASPINCGWHEYAIAKLIFYSARDRLAQAIETQRAETGTGSVEDESAVGSADAPNPSVSDD